MNFWDTVASRNFLQYIQSIAESLEVIADYIVKQEESKDNN